MPDDSMNLMIRHKRTVHAHRQRGSRRQIQHVTVPEQVLGTHLIKNCPRVDFSRHLEGNTRRDVRFDQARDDID